MYSLEQSIGWAQSYVEGLPLSAFGGGGGGEPAQTIASMVQAFILASPPIVWAFNRSHDDSITTAVGQQDYDTGILDFGFLEKCSLQVTDESGKYYELKDIYNNEPLAKSTTQARPAAIAVQDFGTAPPSQNSFIKSSFTFADFMDNTGFSFTIPNTVDVGDTVVFALEMSNGSGDPSNISDSLGNPIQEISSQNAGNGSLVQTELGLANAYAILAAAGITNSGATLITGGDIGSYPTTSITGFTGANFTAPAAIDNTHAQAALAAALIAYNFYSAQTFTSLSGSSANLSVLGNGSTVSTYLPGNYSAGSSMDIPTSITLDAQGNANAIFVFKAGSTLTLESNQSILLINGAQAANVVWLVGTSATVIGTTGTFQGNILANTSITIDGGTFNGRALAGVVTSSGAVTIATAVAFNVAAGSTDRHQFVVYNMPVVFPGTSTITIQNDVSMNRNYLVQGLLLTGVGPIQLTSPVNSNGVSQTWTSNSITVTPPSNLLVSFNVAYAPPATPTDNFDLELSGVIPDLLYPDVQLSTSVLFTNQNGTFAANSQQASSDYWQQVLVAYPTLAIVGLPTPNFRFSAVPDKVYPCNLIYQKAPRLFTSLSQTWDMPDSFISIFNNMFLGEILADADDQRSQLYRQRGMSALLSRAEGLTAEDKSLFMSMYLQQGTNASLAGVKAQQGLQGRAN
jgi:hypothetical protein